MMRCSRPKARACPAQCARLQVQPWTQSRGGGGGGWSPVGRGGAGGWGRAAHGRDLETQAGVGAAQRGFHRGGRWAAGEDEAEAVAALRQGHDGGGARGGRGGGPGAGRCGGRACRWARRGRRGGGVRRGGPRRGGRGRGRRPRWRGGSAPASRGGGGGGGGGGRPRA